MSVLILSAGVLLVAVALIDVAWTTVAAGSGAGPVTGRLAGWLWSAARAVHRRRPSHTWLSVAGVAIVSPCSPCGSSSLLAGWLLVFSSADGAIRTRGRMHLPISSTASTSKLLWIVKQHLEKPRLAMTRLGAGLRSCVSR